MYNVTLTIYDTAYFIDVNLKKVINNITASTIFSACWFYWFMCCFKFMDIGPTCTCEISGQNVSGTSKRQLEFLLFTKLFIDG